MIIDFRLRPPLKSFLELGIYKDLKRVARYSWNFGMELPPSVMNYSVDLLFSEMDEAGISMGVVPGRKGAAYLGQVSNDDIMDIVRQYPKRFVGVCGIDASDRQGSIEEIERTVVNGPLKGVGLEPGVQPNPMRCDDARIYPIYEFCAQHNVPVLIMGGGGNGPDQTYSMPQDIEHVCIDFPTLTVINTHGGYPWVPQILFTAMRRPNLYLCPDMYMFNMPGAQDYVTAANYFLQDRFLFGTAYPYIPHKVAVSMFKEMGFKEEVLPKVFWKNAARALNLDINED